MTGRRGRRRRLPLGERVDGGGTDGERAAATGAAGSTGRGGRRSSLPLLACFFARGGAPLLGRAAAAAMAGRGAARLRPAPPHRARPTQRLSLTSSLPMFLIEGQNCNFTTLCWK